MNAVKVTDRAAAHLADPDKEFFGFATLLPYLEEALDELQVELIGHGSQFLKKSIDTTFQPSDTSLEIDLDDLVEPIKVSVVIDNRLLDLRQQLSQLEWTSSPADANIWTWTGGQITIGPHTDVNTLRFLYYRMLTVADPIIEDTVISFPNSLIFLAFRVAELAARYLGLNRKLADDLGISAFVNLNKLIARDVKSLQSIVTIRRPYFRTGRRSIADI